MGYDDLPRTFALLRYAGELGEAHGQTLWNLTRDWSAGPRAASLETRVATSGVADPTSTSIIDDESAVLLAQNLDAPPPPARAIEPAGLEEVVVTAQKRS